MDAPTLAKELTIVFHDSDDGGYVTECLEIPGCLSQGETQQEALANIKDAIQSCLAVLFEDALKDAMTHRTLGEVTFTDVGKQARLRIVIPNFATEEAVA